MRLAVILIVAVASVACREPTNRAQESFETATATTQISSAANQAQDSGSSETSVVPPDACDGEQFLPVASVERAPTVDSSQPPEYPPLGTRVKIRGAVVVRVFVRASGQVCAVEVVKGVASEIDQSVLEAIRRWKFKPALASGKPVGCHIRMTVNVNLRGGAEQAHAADANAQLRVSKSGSISECALEPLMRSVRHRMTDDAKFNGLWSLGQFEAEDGPALVRFRRVPPEKFQKIWSEQFVIEWQLERSRPPSDRGEDPDWLEFERRIVPALERDNQSCLAFVVTGTRYREWYFYCGDLAEMQGRLNREVRRQPSLPIELHAGHDPEWRIYWQFVGPFAQGGA